MKFKEMPYERPDIQAILNELDEINVHLASSSDAVEQIELIKKLDMLKKDFETSYSLCSVRHSINTKDEFYEQENSFFNENAPLVAAAETKVNKTILESPFRSELEREFGSHYFQLLDCSLALKDEAIPYLQKENDLVSRYEKLIANAKIEFRGETYTLTQMAPHLQNPDREYRREAYKAQNAWFRENEDSFDQIYDDMVKVRNSMAKALGYENYVALQYKLLNRTDYDARDVAGYRDKILSTITPLAVKLRQQQANRLEIEDFKYFDLPIDFRSGNAKPLGDDKFIVKEAQTMYSQLSPETGRFFSFMVENELMDLNARPGKRSGGYCTSFDKYKSPFIFSNFNGSKGDVEVITHEAGHAFQNFMSQDMPLSSLIWPTYEACEIHSMSMEFLTWPWMDLFFGDQAEKFKYSALKGAITFIPYGCTIDEFQHFVYEHPEASPAERKEQYHKIEMKYQPDLDYDDDFLNGGTYWFRQGHVFSSPFYYIDYTLAQVCAFQYLLKSLDDRKACIDEYIALCKAGGEKSFFQLLEVGGIENPMTTDVLERICPRLLNILENMDVR